MLFKRLVKNRTFIFLVLIIILLIPTFWRMLKPGIFSMQDPTLFRFYEYDKCFQDLQLPCRWSPDVAFEYGQPLFNFYGQLSYFFGEIFRLLGFSIIDSVKALFIFSLVASAIGMFLLGRQIWGSNAAGLVSALIYTYAPYRAVDIYVRGALPEAFGFIFFPFVTYFFNSFVMEKNYLTKRRSLLFFILMFAGLILNHNLSALMFLFFFIPWGLYLLFKEKSWNIVPWLMLSGVAVVGVISFYILPVIFESKYITLEKVVDQYYFFKNHYISIYQIFIRNYWGYGASLWGEDDRLSLSVGYIQWILPLIIIVAFIVNRRIKDLVHFSAFLLLGLFALFLTHYKGEFIWELITPLQFIQFPWRFLGLAVFSLSLSSGAIILFFKNLRMQFIIVSLIVAALIGLNTSLFFEDLWWRVDDQKQFSGKTYEWQLGSSKDDYWPKYGIKSPIERAPSEPIILNGEGAGRLVFRRSNSSNYSVDIASFSTEVQFPIVYFPGWQASEGNSNLKIYPSGDLGLITMNLNEGSHNIDLKFKNTFVRSAGNIISLLSIVVIIALIMQMNSLLTLMTAVSSSCLTIINSKEKKSKR